LHQIGKNLIHLGFGDAVKMQNLSFNFAIRSLFKLGRYPNFKKL
jgi:hypothetical protein